VGAALGVQELRSDNVQVLAQLPCLIYLELIAKTIPENNIIIHPNTFHSLKRFKFICELSRFTFEPAAMPRLQRLEIELDGRGQGAMQLQKAVQLVVSSTLLALKRSQCIYKPNASRDPK
jgi:hypothetical protein